MLAPVTSLPPLSFSLLSPPQSLRCRCGFETSRSRLPRLVSQCTPSLSLLLITEITNVCATMPDFLMWLWGSNSGPHVGRSSTLPTGPSPWLSAFLGSSLAPSLVALYHTPASSHVAPSELSSNWCCFYLRTFLF